MNYIHAVISLFIFDSSNLSKLEVSQLTGVIVCVIMIVAFCYSYIFRNKRGEGQASQNHAANLEVNKEERNERAKQQDE